MARPKSLRPNDPQLHLAILSKYKDMTNFNRQLNSAENWTCDKCLTKRHLVAYYGCKECKSKLGEI